MSGQVVKVLRHHDVGQVRVGALGLPTRPGDKREHRPTGQRRRRILPDRRLEMTGALSQRILLAASGVDRIEYLFGRFAGQAGDVAQPGAGLGQHAAGRLLDGAVVTERAHRVVQGAGEFAQPGVDRLGVQRPVGLVQAVGHRHGIEGWLRLARRLERG